jgi:hypothetical protein
MQVVYALQPLQKSIFLAGPTPRDPQTESWRQEALTILEALAILEPFDGQVFVPEADDWTAHNNYDAQVNWEWEAIDQSTVVVFWIPRDLVSMPAFTTNVEFGLKIQSGRVILGHPTNAPKCGYLDALASRFNTPVYSTLSDTLRAAIERANELHRLTLRNQS